MTTERSMERIRDISEEEVSFFHEHGWVKLESFMSQKTVAELLRHAYDIRTEASKGDTQSEGQWTSSYWYSWTRLVFSVQKIQLAPFLALHQSKAMGRAASRLINRQRLTDEVVPIQYINDEIFCKTSEGSAGSDVQFREEGARLPTACHRPTRRSLSCFRSRLRSPSQTMTRRRFLCLLTLSGCLMLGMSWASESRHDEKQTSTLFILLDGFRWDLVTPATTPNLARLAEKGVQAEMIPVWPTISSPNHLALATGLYPIHTRAISNEMYDPETRSVGSWTTTGFWRGEPIWATVARQGGLSGLIGRWVGGPNMPPDRSPSFYVPYDDDCVNCASVVLGLLDQPQSQLPWKHSGFSKRPRLLAVFVGRPDRMQHQHGVGSPEALADIAQVDAMIGDLTAGIAARNLDSQVNIVIVADHGQMNVPKEQRIELERFIDESQLQTQPLGSGPLMQLWPKPGLEEKVYRSLRSIHPRVHALRPGDIPARMHCCDPATTPPVLLTTDPGWSVHYKGKNMDITGQHGYDNQVRDMHALFIAAGPDIRAGVSVKPFANVDVYSLLARLLKVAPAKTDGSIASLCPILIDPPAGCESVMLRLEAHAHLSH